MVLRMGGTGKLKAQMCFPFTGQVLACLWSCKLTSSFISFDLSNLQVTYLSTNSIIFHA